MAKNKQAAKPRGNGRRDNKQTKNTQTNGAGRKRKLFIKTFLITTVALGAIIFGGRAYLLNWIKPPDIIASEDDFTSDIQQDAASIPLHTDDEDRHVGGGMLIGLDNISTSDRKKDFYTFVIFGTDDAGYNTDTIMVASYDGVNQNANIISIPRDCLVNVKRTAKRINAAYGAGTLNGGGHEGGVDQLKREIKTIIGFEPDFYIMIDLEAFTKIVDAIGGVDVENPYYMNYDDPVQDLHIHFNKGPLHLDGPDALKFARFRQGNNHVGDIGDFKRIENQQLVINAILQKLLKPENILKIPQFIEIFNENVKTDLKTENILWFAGQINEIRGTDALSMYTMPTNGSSTKGAWYALLDEAAIIELINRTINPYTFRIKPENLDIITVVP